MKTKSIGFILIFFLLSCNSDKRTNLSSNEKKYADSIYNISFDSLKKVTKIECDSLYKAVFETTMDSLKPIRLKEIDELFEN
jgi:hypothetical protein